jgi:SAM-dependent methyltransferase
MRLASLMENRLVYRLWQAPFAEDKFAPIRRHNDLRQVRRVLDVGCGPGTNAQHFAHCDYTGIDLNPGYIEDARRRYGRNFITADATAYTPEGEPYDFILINSFLHHLPTPAVEGILQNLATLLTPGGHIHILELIMPAEPSVARLLARMDRGNYARPEAEWRALFERDFATVLFEPYPLRGLGATLWNMVYFKGQPKLGSAKNAPAQIMSAKS